MPTSGTKNKALLFGGIGLLLAAIGVTVSLFLLRQPQDTRQKAASENGTAEVQISPTTATLEPGASTTATVSFNTGGTRINAIAARLSYPFTGTTTPIIVDPEDIVIEPALIGVGGMSCTVKSVQDTTSPVTIDVACTTNIGYSNTAFTNFFSFKLTAGPDGTDTPVPITFDLLRTVIGVGEQDIAAIPTTSLDVTLPIPAATTQKQMDIRTSAQCDPSELMVSSILTNGDTTPIVGTNVTFNFNDQTLEKVSDADGESAVTFTYTNAGSYVLTINAEGYTEQKNNVQIAECSVATPTPTPTPTLSSCNGACTTSADCSYGLACYGSQCRSLSCQSDVTCLCQTTNVASTSSTTTLLTTGSFDRTLVLLLIGGLLTVGGIQVLLGRGSRMGSEWTEGDSNP